MGGEPIRASAQAMLTKLPVSVPVGDTEHRRNPIDGISYNLIG